MRSLWIAYVLCVMLLLVICQACLRPIWVSPPVETVRVDRLDEFAPALERTGAEYALYNSFRGEWRLIDRYGHEVGVIELGEDL